MHKKNFLWWIMILVLIFIVGYNIFLWRSQEKRSDFSPQYIENAKTTSSKTQNINATQAQQLQYLIEEEKLARDVYTTLYATRWISKFNNILNAEENHQAKVAKILSTYGIANPTDGNNIWVFTDPALQELYESLIAQWKKSASDALNVWVIIEKKDIADIDAILPMFTWKSDIIQVLEDLRAGSYRHLKAFSQ